MHENKMTIRKNIDFINKEVAEKGFHPQFVKYAKL
jgi:hypothetical protein